jgi:hypothetical protein
MLYRIARAAIAEQVASDISSGGDKDLAENIRDAAEPDYALTQELLAQSPDPQLGVLRTSVEAEIKRPEKLASVSVLRRSEHFSAAVVAVVDACRGPTETVDGFIACLQRRAKSDFSLSVTSMESKVQSALQPVPTYQIWSGVRETTFSPDPKLSFLTDRKPSSLRFMLQAAFTSEPHQKSLDASGAGQASEVNEPYEFENLNQKISDKVLQMVAGDPEKKDVLDGVVEFTALQRLFRLALHGDLGTDFPVEKLSALAAATSADVKRQKTPRWNPHYDELGFLARLAKAAPHMQGEMKRMAESCLTANAFPTALNDSDDTLAPLLRVWRSQPALEAKVWDATCSFPDSLGSDSELSDLTKYSRQFLKFRKLRHAVGLDAAERSEAEACGPL